MKRRQLLLLLVMLFYVSYDSTAQSREIISEPIIWSQATINKRLNDAYSTSLAIQYRAFLDRENGYHLYFDLKLVRNLQYGFSLAVGFINLNINQFVDSGFVLVPELRPYQSIQYATKLNRSKFSWRLMVEERFFKKAAEGDLIEGYESNFRFRHKAAYQQHLFQDWRFTVSSEVMFNAVGIDLNIFDQHRTQALLGTTFNKLSIDVGYMHWFVQTATNRHENRHTLFLATALSI
ncbi:MAG: DUF2490 domain-containing protein [Bacteroidota bacterium]